MILLVDLDNTILDWSAAYDSRAAEFEHLGLLLSANQKSFDLFAGLSEEGQNAVLNIFNEPGFYRNLDIYPGAVDTLNYLRDEKGWDIFLCSSPWLTNDTCASDKYAWVTEHMGPEWANKLILTRDKSLVHGDVLIDDKPNVREHPKNTNKNPSWQQVYVTHEYNRKEDGLLRMQIEDWQGDPEYVAWIVMHARSDALELSA